MSKKHLFLPFLILLLVGCSPAPMVETIVIRDAWMRLPPKAMPGAHTGANATPAMEQGMMEFNSAAYFLILNQGKSEDRLLKVRTNIANAVEMHRTDLVGDIMTMRPVDSIAIAASGQVELKPGGYHIMLIGLKQDLAEGEIVQLELEFEKAGIIPVQVVVRSP